MDLYIKGLATKDCITQLLLRLLVYKVKRIDISTIFVLVDLAFQESPGTETFAVRFFSLHRFSAQLRKRKKHTL